MCSLWQCSLKRDLRRNLPRTYQRIQLRQHTGRALPVVSMTLTVTSRVKKNNQKLVAASNFVDRSYVHFLLVTNLFLLISIPIISLDQ